MPTLEVCSTLAFRARMSASIRATEASRARLLDAVVAPPAKCITPAVANAPPSAPATAASATTAASADKPPLAEHSLRLLGFHFRLNALVVPVRSPDDMIMILPGRARRVGLGGIGSFNLGRLQPWELQPWSRPPWGRRPARAPDREISTSATAFGVSCAAAGWLAASDELETSGPALTDPVSPLVGSACCSLTFKFSRKGSLFGNFHSLRNRYRQAALPKF